MIPQYGCVIIFVLLILIVISRVIMLKRIGMDVFVFAKTHHTDLLLPPFVILFVYHLFSNVFGMPRINGEGHFQWLSWIGLMICFLGFGLFLWGVLSFGNSFRVGIDNQHPDKLITTGAFAITRNPLYVAFGMELIGIFLIFPTIFFLFYVIAGFWVLRRQMIREEAFLKQYYGKEFDEYCLKVRRYF